jgi:hypothetical protein
VDGYFTRWPENAKILLNRGKNGQPDLLEYSYGQGKVIVSGLYSDWANSHSQRTIEEYFLAKQLIAYALNPAQPLTQNLVYKDPSLKMWVTSPTEYTVRGSTVPYTIHVKNNSTTDLKGANISFYGHELGGNFFYHIGSFENITVAAGEEKTFLQNVLVTGSNTYLISLFEPGKQFKGFTSVSAFYYSSKIYTTRIIWVKDPQVTLGLKTTKNVYGEGDSSGTVQIDLKELQGISYQAALRVSIVDPDNLIYSEQTIPVDIAAASALRREVLFSLPPGLAAGIYTVKAAVMSGADKVGEGLTTFEIPQAKVAITPIMPAAVGNGRSLSFKLLNYGLAYVKTGTLALALLQPNGAVCWTIHKEFSDLAIGAEITISETIAPPSMRV